ncbi:hypothetical protein [Synechococcus sp. PCC 6312]|uniref:hypothetical protein n=1 Tax=Synechococcus sp. (strain ATCC 27167 / PCC 6312) TaxID=195253 RepID=UPI00029F3C6F|nr:hypothetical protein [Synechococcus sp. PCC 6312]AFY60136.1 hypothetical protein Syn6312_0934 [Synechococcus sp. PCC 6312]
MKLSELKQLVYDQAQARTPKELKAQYPSLRSLDFRRKQAWQTALKLLSPLSKPAEPNLSYEEWRANPPPEYRELFANLDATTQAFDQHYATAQALNAELINIADELESLSSELETEAKTWPNQPPKPPKHDPAH